MGAGDFIELIERIRLWKQRQDTMDLEKILHPLLETLGSYFPDTNISLFNYGPLSRADFSNDDYLLRCNATVQKKHEEDEPNDRRVYLEITVLPKEAEWKTVYEKEFLFPRDKTIIPDIANQEVKPALEKILY